MFIQVIEGKVRDAEAVHERLKVWERDLQPGAIGYLGSTGGCTTDGDCILIARFESEEAARRNSDRPEQGAWWAATEELFDGPVTFHDTTDVQVMSHGSLDDAHFVQVMEGHVTDRSRADALTQESDDVLTEERPDLLGSVTAYYGDGDYTELAYFTSEADARQGEAKDMPPEMEKAYAEFQETFQVDRYLDIREPWLTTA
jgi:hypothetical protein